MMANMKYQITLVEMSKTFCKVWISLRLHLEKLELKLFFRSLCFCRTLATFFSFKKKILQKCSVPRASPSRPSKTMQLLVDAGFWTCKLVWVFLLPNHSSRSCCCWSSRKSGPCNNRVCLVSFYILIFSVLPLLEV